MRVVTQVAVVAVLAGLAGAGWYFKDAILPAGKAAQANAPAAGARATPVEVARVTKQEITQRVETVGTALANEAVTITAKQAGIIRRINFQEGQKVPAGTILVELDAGENEARVEELRSARENAETAFKRLQQLFEAGTVARARLDEAQRTYEQTDFRVKAELARRGDLTIKTPFAGRLGLREVSQGALVRPGDRITTLDDTSVIKLEFELPEVVAGTVTPGTKVIAQAAAYPGRKFDGQVQIVDSRVDPVTRAFRVRATLPNTEDVLKPGMFMTTEIGIARKVDALLIPEEAILATGTNQYVFVVRDNRAVRTKIRTGQRIGPMVEVLEGLPDGVTVVTAGLQQVRDGAAVRVVPPPGQPAARPTPTAGQPAARS